MVLPRREGTPLETWVFSRKINQKKDGMALHIIPFNSIFSPCQRKSPVYDMEETGLDYSSLFTRD